MDTRVSRPSEQAEEALERLWASLVEGGHTAVPLADSALLGHAAGIAELTQSELVWLRNGKVSLTPAGHEAAAGAVRRHRLAERMAVDVLAIEGERAEEAACGLEHSLREGVDEAVCSLLGHPELCPHGNPIPAGDCCRQDAESAGNVAPLSNLRPGESGRVSYVQMGDSRRLQKLMAMGILPGKAIRLVQGFPSYVFQIGHSQFAVDREIAATIHVRLEVPADR